MWRACYLFCGTARRASVSPSSRRSTACRRPDSHYLDFMDRAQALAHLTSVCIPEDSDEAALSKIWAAAKEKLGTPIRGAGSPSIRTLPPAFDAHCRAVLSQAAFRDGGSFLGAFACLVEVAPLLTPQFVVDQSRLAHHRAEAREATLPTALETCLPLTARSEPFQRRISAIRPIMQPVKPAA